MRPVSYTHLDVYKRQSYDRSSHNMTDKRAWFGNFDQGQFIRQEENGGRPEYVMMDAEGTGAVSYTHLL